MLSRHCAAICVNTWGLLPTAWISCKLPSSIPEFTMPPKLTLLNQPIALFSQTLDGAQDATTRP